MKEEDVVALASLNETEKALLRAVAQLGQLTAAVEKRGHKVLFGDFTMRDGSKNTVYVEWERPEVATLHEISHANADQAKEIARMHAVIEYCLEHLERAEGDASYIQSHVAIRLRDILDGNAASTYVGGIERSRKRWMEKAEAMQGILRDVFQEDDGIMLSQDLRQRIQDALPRQEKLNGLAEIPGKEDNRPTQGGGAGGFNDPGK